METSRDVHSGALGFKIQIAELKKKNGLEMDHRICWLYD